VIRVGMESPGANTYATDYQIIDDLNMIKVVNHIDKLKEYEPEAVHLAFPFLVPGGQIRYDLAYGYCEPEKDQAPGSNKNFLEMEHWVDVSTNGMGVTLICPDSPIFEVGKITMDEIVTGWVDSIPASQTVISYLMNNYWETNYAASQEGEGTYSYVLLPHGEFNAAGSEKAAISERQPLIGRLTGSFQKPKASLIDLEDENLIITNIKPAREGKSLILSIINPGETEEFPFFLNPFTTFYHTDPDGVSEYKPAGATTIPAQGVLHLKLIK
jgi:alpha-mannosidase